LRGLFEIMPKRTAAFFLDVDSNTEGNSVASESNSGCYILMASDISACKRVSNPADRLHCFASFLLFGVIEKELNGIAFGRVEHGK
jgi:hypothetical protein